MPDPVGTEDAVMNKILSAIDPIIDATAHQLGRPPASAKYSTDEQVSMATFSPYRDPETAVQALAQAGKQPGEIMDAVYPKWRGLIETGRPNIAERIKYGAFLGREIEKRGGWQAATQGTPMGGPSGPLS